MYKNLVFNLGRDALEYLVKEFNIKEMHIPYYLCDVVRHTLVKNGCSPIFYHIDNSFYPAKEFDKNDYILYPNYWGVCGNNVKKLINIYPKLIIDNAHAYYDKPSGFACFNAGHKFGFKDSYLWINNNSGIEETQYCAAQTGKEERKNIFLELHKKYGKTNLLDIDTECSPFVYPYLANSIEKADELAKNLKEEGKTVYRYWSPLPKSYNEYKFYSRLVPIPILPH